MALVTHMVSKNAAINFKNWVSLLLVSSNPGISIRMTCRPSSVNLSTSCTPAVHDSKSLVTRRSEPLAVLMN
jgi:hypothetical protein